MNVCDLCSRVFDTEQGLTMHLAKSHDPSLAATRQRVDRNARGAAARIEVQEGFGASWWEQGACAGMANEVFFPPVSGNYRRAGRPEVLPAEQAAIEICGLCDVRAQCLEWALAHEDHGIWGGMTANQRRRLRANAGGRPRSDDERDTIGARARRLLARGWDADEVAVALGLPSIEAVERLATEGSAA